MLYGGVLLHRVLLWSTCCYNKKPDDSTTLTDSSHLCAAVLHTLCFTTFGHHHAAHRKRRLFRHLVPIPCAGCYLLLFSRNIQTTLVSHLTPKTNSSSDGSKFCSDHDSILQQPKGRCSLLQLLCHQESRIRCVLQSIVRDRSSRSNNNAYVPTVP